VWLLGVAVFGTWVVSRDLNFANRISRTRMVTQTEILQILEDCRRTLEIRFPVSLLETKEVDTPALYGVLHPRLLIPKGVINSFEEKELRHVFMHELSHVKRRDMLMHWLMTLVQVLHWYNPLVWVAMARMSVDRELACDALALSHQVEPEENESYGETLIKLLERFIQPVPSPGIVGLLEKDGSMRERMMMIAGFERAPRWQVPAAIIFVLLGAACLTDARTKIVESGPLPDGLVSWWRAENNAEDSTSQNHGRLEGRMNFTEGISGKAFSFNGVDAHIKVPASPTLDIGHGSGFTISLWLKPQDISVGQPILEWNSGLSGVHFWFSPMPDPQRSEPGALYCAIKDIHLKEHTITSPAKLVKPQVFQHVAITYDKPNGMAALYYNGKQVANTYVGIFPPKTQEELYIGLRPFDEGAGTRFSGEMDDIQIFERALSSDEIKSVFEYTGSQYARTLTLTKSQ
jgi:hypothetical protein